MDEFEKIFDMLIVDRELVFQFFAIFSSFEYSLKRSDYLKSGEKAQPDWDMYADRLRGKFAEVQDPKFKEAVTYLLDHPPKTEVVSGSNGPWKKPCQGSGEHFEKYVLRLVRSVRNNLFHGGKYPHPTGPVPDVGRDQKLLETSILVLKQCLQLEASQNVRDFFMEPA